MASLTFHVPSEAGPDKILPLLQTMKLEKPKFSGVKELLAFAQEYGLGSRTEMQIVSTSAGLLDKKHGKVYLSETAKALLENKSETQIDLVHYLLYTAWQEEKPDENSYLWSYRQVVDFLWKHNQIDDVSGMRYVMAEEINNRTATVFAEVEGYEMGKVSFGPKSIRGVLVWLEALKPPVIQDNQFTRRHFCSPELMLLAMAWVAQQTGGELEIDFLLTPDRREALGKLCLLDLNDVDNVINWTLPKYAAFVEPGTSAGVYGRFLRFLRWPQIVDLG